MYLFISSILLKKLTNTSLYDWAEVSGGDWWDGRLATPPLGTFTRKMGLQPKDPPDDKPLDYISTISASAKRNYFPQRKKSTNVRKVRPPAGSDNKYGMYS